MHRPMRYLKKSLYIIAAVLVALVAVNYHSASAAGTDVFINEIATDSSFNITLEIVSPEAKDLTGWTLAYYSDNNGPLYDSSVALTDGQSAVSNGFRFTTITTQSFDHWAIVDDQGNVMQFITASVFGVAAGTATDGPAAGMTSEYVGWLQLADVPFGLTGTGSFHEDFTWSQIASTSFGSPNPGQTFKAAPPPDTTAPQVTTFAPAQGMSSVAVDTTISLTFDEDVQAGQGTVDIWEAFEGTEPSLLASIAVGEVQALADPIGTVIFNGNVVTIDLNISLREGRTYGMEIRPEVITDMAGNPFYGTYTNLYQFISGSELTPDPYLWEFNTVYNPPLLVEQNPLSPANGAQNVPVNTSQLTMTFTEDIFPDEESLVVSSISVSAPDENPIYYVEIGGEILNAAEVPPYTISGNVMTLNMPTSFSEGKTYTVTMSYSTLIDFDQLPFVGFSKPECCFDLQAAETNEKPQPYQWSFTTEDNTPPALVQGNEFNPANGATGVSTTASLTMSFNESVGPGSGSITIYDDENNLFEQFTIGQVQQAATTGVSFEGSTIVTTPSSSFAEGETYYVMVSNGAIVDNFGNAFAGITDANVWRFTVEDVTNPVITVTGDNPMEVTQGGQYQELGATATDNVDGDLTQSIQTSGSVDTNTPGQYTITYTVSDGAGNQAQATRTVNVVDGAAPIVAQLSPANNAPSVPYNAPSLQVTFDENVTEGSLLDIAIYERDRDNGNRLFDSCCSVNVDAAVENTPFAAFENNVMTITPSKDFAAATTYFVTIGPDSVEDSNGNKFAGFSDENTWAFTTAALPAVNITASDANASEDGDTAAFTVNNPTNGVLTVTANIGGTATYPADYALSFTGGSIDSGVYTLPLQPGDNIVGVTASNDSEEEDAEIVSLTLNSGEGYSVGGNSSATATIADNDNFAPRITSVSPSNNAENVPVNTQLVVTVSESVQVQPIPVTLTCQPTGDTFGMDVTAAGNTYTLTLARNLPLDATCTLSIPVTAVTDSRDNNLVDEDGNNANDNTYTVVFKTPRTPPSIVGTSPSNGAVDVAPGSNISLTMSESVRIRRTGVQFVCQPSGQPVLGKLSISGNTYTLNPRVNMPMGNTCTLSIPVSSITDDAGNAVIDNDDTANGVYTLSFQIDAAPRILSTSPSNGATGVDVNSNISITVSERVRVERRGVRFVCDSVGGVRGRTSADGNTYTLNPASALPANDTCTLTIPVGNIVDMTGNVLVDDDGNPDDTYTLTFQTTGGAELFSAEADAPEVPVTETPSEVEIEIGEITLSDE